jgi:hypothetical protein
MMMWGGGSMFMGLLFLLIIYWSCYLYYKSDIELTVIDFSSGMLGIARNKYG